MNPNAIMAGIQMFGAYVDAKYQNEMVGIQNDLAVAQASADANVLFANNTLAAAQAAYTTQARSLNNRRAGAQLSAEALAAAESAVRTDANLQAQNFEASIAASEQMGQAAALGAVGSVADAIALSTSLRNARQQQYLKNQRADVAASNSAAMARFAMQITHSQDLGYTTVGQQFQRPVANRIAEVSPLYAMLKAGAGQAMQAATNATTEQPKPLGVTFQTGTSPTTMASWVIPVGGGYTQ